MLIDSMPAFRSSATSRSTISAVCLRPVRANSGRTNDCTPRLTRLIPAHAHASAFSAVTVPGAASNVASDHDLPGISASISARARGSIWLGVPPPK